MPWIGITENYEPFEVGFLVLWPSSEQGRIWLFSLPYDTIVMLALSHLCWHQTRLLVVVLNLAVNLILSDKIVRSSTLLQTHEVLPSEHPHKRVAGFTIVGGE